MWMRKNFPKNKKMTPSCKKVTYSNSSLKLWRVKIGHWINTCEKKGLISWGKDRKRNHKPFAKASQSVFIIANASVYSNASHEDLQGAIKAYQFHVHCWAFRCHACTSKKRAPCDIYFHLEITNHEPKNPVREINLN